MRSLLLTKPLVLEWIADKKRKLKSDEVMVETIASAISIGSELPQYRGDARLGYSIPYPTMTGYENVGYISDVGSTVENVKIGQRVIAFYGYRTKAIVNCNAVIPVADDISDKQALLTILSCDVAKGIRKLKPYPEETVLITGCGAIGLLTTYVMSAYGIRDISVVDPVEVRRSLAIALGAQVAMSLEGVALSETTYSLGVECSGFQSGFEVLQVSMTANGRIVILSDGNREPFVLMPEFHRKELTLLGSSDGWDYAKHAKWFFDVLRESERPIENIFDVTIRSREIADTFEALANNELNAIKVFITDF